MQAACRGPQPAGRTRARSSWVASDPCSAAPPLERPRRGWIGWPRGSGRARWRRHQSPAPVFGWPEPLPAAVPRRLPLHQVLASGSDAVTWPWTVEIPYTCAPALGGSQGYNPTWPRLTGGNARLQNINDRGKQPAWGDWPPRNCACRGPARKDVRSTCVARCPRKLLQSRRTAHARLLMLQRRLPPTESWGAG